MKTYTELLKAIKEIREGIESTAYHTLSSYRQCEISVELALLNETIKEVLKELDTDIYDS